MRAACTVGSSLPRRVRDVLEDGFLLFAQAARVDQILPRGEDLRVWRGSVPPAPACLPPRAPAYRAPVFSARLSVSCFTFSSSERANENRCRGETTPYTVAINCCWKKQARNAAFVARDANVTAVQGRAEGRAAEAA